jgi:hypothetical protein
MGQQVVRRIAGALAGAGLLAIGAFGSLLLLFASAWRCDESCDPTPTSWRVDPHAWQWSGLGVLSVAAFLVLVAAVVLLGLGRRRAGVVALAASGLAYLLTFVWIP